MGWFNKKEKVPDIAPAPILPQLPRFEERQELPELPSFPISPQNNNFNQEMVRSAVADLPSPMEEEESAGAPGELPVEEIPSFIIPAMPQEESPIPEPPKSTFQKKTLQPSIQDKTPSKSNEPIFVRIDKFQAAQKDFDEIKDKVKDIESVLKKIKNVKTKEDEELESWAKEIEELKSRLAEIDSNIFSQI